MKKFLIIFVIIMLLLVLYSNMKLEEYDRTIRRVDREIELMEREER